MNRVLGVVTGLALVLASVSRAEALCAPMEAGDSLASPPAGVLPADGGILVEFDIVLKLEPEHRSARWKLTARGKTVAMKRRTLAPGLTLLRPAAGTAMVTLKIGRVELARYTRDTPIAPFTADAPAPTKLELTTEPGRYESYRRVVTATLSAPVPGDAIGVITYATRKNKQVALSFRRINVGQNSAITFGDPGRCTFHPPGMDAPQTGEQVTLVWVDQFGRLSKPSAPIAMTGSVPTTP